MSPVRARLDATRWHFQHGPIDLVLSADGDDRAIELGWTRFRSVLAELAGELGALRRALTPDTVVAGAVARRMVIACRPHAACFITPMAAVAGAVADEVLAAMRPLQPDRAFVNNGGDIALHLAPGTAFRVGLVADISRHGHGLALDGAFEVRSDMPVRGVATSGWRGRSLSLGIADSVTVLARDAAAADAAATMIANQVDAEHPAIARRRACDVADDTDLGDRLVTVAVGTLPSSVVDAALDRGAVHARTLQSLGLIWGAALVLQGRHRIVGALDAGDPTGNVPGSSLYCVDASSTADRPGRAVR
jgi:ApbE superfamily uncharacterized protein (UPF0280 family)